MSDDKTTEDLIAALFRLLESRNWRDITLSDIADECGIPLAELRLQVDDRFDIVERFARQVDSTVIAAVDPDLAGEPARERLLDVLLNRLDALQPHKAGIAGLVRSARRDLLLSAQLNRLACTSQSWMLEAAGISGEGVRGAVRIQGLVLTFARVLGVWLKDDDPNMARTMAELDKLLKRGETYALGLDRLCKVVAPRRRTRAGNPEDARGVQA